jgi:hypothetical protein
MPKLDFDFPNYYAAHEVESDPSYEAGASLNPCLSPTLNLTRGGGVLTLSEPQCGTHLVKLTSHSMLCHNSLLAG